jgi:hypothetical protein
MKEFRIKIWYFFSICVFFVNTTLCWGQALQDEKESSPQKNNVSIEMSHTIFDFGEIIQGKISSTTFVLRNSGNDTLTIKEVVSSIKMITAILSDDSIQPGEAGNIEVTLDTTPFYGSVVGRITLITDVEDRPEIVLIVKAVVKPILVFNPRYIFVGQLEKDDSYSKQATLLGKLVEEGKLKHYTINTSSPAIKTRIEKQKGKEEKLLLKFKILPELKPGTFKETITLVSEDPPAQAQLDLLGYKVGIIRIEPDRLNFFPPEGKKPGTGSIIFECDKPFKIIKVEANVDFSILKVTTIKKGNKYRLKAKLNKSIKGTILGVVKIFTDLEENPRIDIPVIGNIK